MKRALVGVLATVALALGLSAPASAATPNDHASCLGLRAGLAGQPGLAAGSAHFFIDIANLFGVPPGDIYSGEARRHIGLCA